MRIAIVFNDPGETAPDQDVLVQRDVVTATLRGARHETVPVSCTLDLERLLQILQGLNVDCVFNLVESLGGTDRLACLLPQLLDAAGIPCTGSGAWAMLSTADKVFVKQALRDNGLPTPDWVAGEYTIVTGGTFIIKPRFEHASNGIDDEAVVSVSSAQELLASLHRRSRKTGLPLFAERFIEGREFNIAAIVNDDGGVQILRPAEIDFSGFPVAKPKIVGFNAKWVETSFEHKATPRIFQFPESDAGLLQQLQALTARVWELFNLGGYARVDFRVDDDGNPFILEVNTNPCLSPDAGFAAALSESGLSFQNAVVRIVEAAMTSARP